PDAPSFCGPFDQRGPGFPRINEDIIDIGAVESIPEPTPMPSMLGLMALSAAVLRKVRSSRRRAKQ
ncbi:MAG: hypothetical protein AAGG02_14410, partial [Cyanobacteria bacterium P01_H01_bin.15]